MYNSNFVLQWFNVQSVPDVLSPVLPSFSPVHTITTKVSISRKFPDHPVVHKLQVLNRAHAQTTAPLTSYPLIQNPEGYTELINTMHLH